MKRDHHPPIAGVLTGPLGGATLTLPADVGPRAAIDGRPHLDQRRDRRQPHGDLAQPAGHRVRRSHVMRAVRRPWATRTAVFSRRSRSYARNASPTFPFSPSAFPSATASTIACAAPWPVCGSTGWAASPSRVTTPWCRCLADTPPDAAAVVTAFRSGAEQSRGRGRGGHGRPQGRPSIAWYHAVMSDAAGLAQRPCIPRTGSRAGRTKGRLERLS